MKYPYALYATLDTDALAEKLGTSFEEGLTRAATRERAEKFGLNRVDARENGVLHILLRQVRSPFIYLLLAASILAFLFEDAIGGGMIFLFVAVNTLLGFYQEYRSEQTIKLLRKYVVAHALVRRDGKELSLPSEYLVPGDIVVLRPGDVIPADVRIVRESGCSVNESVLTGESVSVPKTAGTLESSPRSIFEARNIGFGGTVIAEGEAEAVVVATGKDTSMGQIAKAAADTSHVSTFEKGISRFSTFTLRLIAITLLVVFLANLLLKEGTVDFVELVIFSIALAVSVIPEALPVVTTFSLSRGALRLAKNKVVVKRLSAIEDLGSIDVLCTDKTGTLTENLMSLGEIYGAARGRVLLYAGIAASFLAPRGRDPNNAFDMAIWDGVGDALKQEIKSYSKIASLPFDPRRRRDAVVAGKGNERELIVRGAPEDVMARCKSISKDEHKGVEEFMAGEGARGRRIIAVARERIAKTEVPAELLGEDNLEFVGLISFFDPIKKTTVPAIAKAKHLGVEVKILTGDRSEVAGAVAREIGLVEDAKDVITGDAFEALSDEEKEKAVWRYDVFARITPLQKHQIIALLEKSKEVGFLGEGINDAPALKAANVSLVVQHASFVAQDAADIVLLKKSLEVIIDGIEEGRRVFANSVKYIRATLASNLGNFYAVAIASLIIPFLPMLPVQILLVNLLTDFPMISIATDNVDAKELARPRNYNFRDITLVATLLGLVSMVFDFIVFGLFHAMGEQVLQTNWFIASVITELAFLFSVRTELPFFRAQMPSLSIIALSLLAAGTALLIPYTLPGQEVFGFITPVPAHLGMIFGVGTLYFAATEVIKYFYYRERGMRGA